MWKILNRKIVIEINEKISIFGAGSFGCAAAFAFNKNKKNVTLWSYSEEETRMLLHNRENKIRLPGVKLPESIDITNNLKLAAKSDIIIVSVPSPAVRQTAKLLKGLVDSSAIIVSVAKGIEKETLKGGVEVIKEELPDNEVAIMCGPSHAEELGKGIQTSFLVACENLTAAKHIRELLQSDIFRIYASDDVRGVEISSTFKNIIAIAAGICDGLCAGDNIKAVLITKGLFELAKLGLVVGAKIQTFVGIAGLGDLIVTCDSVHGRNRKMGMLLGKGLSVEEAHKEVKMIVEGYNNAECVCRFMKKYNIDLPIMRCVYEILYENRPVKDILDCIGGYDENQCFEKVWF